MRNLKVRLVFYGIATSLLLLILVGVFVFAGVKSANATPGHVTVKHPPNMHEQCLTEVPEGQLSPVGGTWTLTVSWLTGRRAGQQETSLMTFLPGGGLTATFPGSFVPPTSDGKWCMVGLNVFEYGFKDQFTVNGQVIVLKTHISAALTSESTYVAGGVGVGYSPTGQALPGIAGVTQTSATRS